jgi:hypothetical protein
MIAGKSERTLRNWCDEHGIGRRIAGGSWAVSKVALAMLLDGDLAALAAYRDRGARASSEPVAAYYPPVSSSGLASRPDPLPDPSSRGNFGNLRPDRQCRQRRRSALTLPSPCCAQDRTTGRGHERFTSRARAREPDRCRQGGRRARSHHHLRICPACRGRAPAQRRHRSGTVRDAASDRGIGVTERHQNADERMRVLSNAKHEAVRGRSLPIRKASAGVPTNRSTRIALAMDLWDRRYEQIIKAAPDAVSGMARQRLGFIVSRHQASRTT